jgi:hypothetical protein
MSGARREAGLLALLTLLMTPVAILLHELGHFATPLFFDLPAQLHPTRVSGGAGLGSGLPAWMIALQAGGGPLVTILMSLGAAWLYIREPRRLWALALAIAVAGRLLVTTAYLGLRLVLLILGTPYSGQPNFDEYNLARALGITPELVVLAATAFLLGLFYLLLQRLDRGRRILFLIASMAAYALANLLWASYAPPVLATIG